MKKFLIGAVFALGGLSAIAESTVCALDDKNTVEIQFAQFDAGKGEAIVAVGSDAPYPANVTVTVTAKYEHIKDNTMGRNREYETREYMGCGLAKKETTTQIIVHGIPSQLTIRNCVFNLISVEGTNITGRKCQ